MYVLFIFLQEKSEDIKKLKKSEENGDDEEAEDEEEAEGEEDEEEEDLPEGEEDFDEEGEGEGEGDDDHVLQDQKSLPFDLFRTGSFIFNHCCLRNFSFFH